MLNKKKAVILLVILAAIFIGLSIRGGNISIPSITSRPSDFDVRTPQEVADSLSGLEEDESNLFSSPAAVDDDGIYFQEPAPTFEESALEIAKIADDFPIFIDGVRTSANITTSISMYVRSVGSQDVLSIHINGINYNEADASDSNPQYKAFVESLQRARTELDRRGVNPDKLLVSFGTRQYIVDTANNWARTSGAL